MNMSDRTAAIEAMLSKNPEDVFLRYSLGMEYASTGRLDEACEQFDLCLHADADYLPAYVEAGKAYRQAGRGNKAKEMFARGLEIALKTGDNHTADRIRQQMELLK